MLVVYVDDFKMSGPKQNLSKGWELIGKHIRLETPSPLGRYLGCHHRAYSTDILKRYNPSGSYPSLPELLYDKIAFPKGAQKKKISPRLNQPSTGQGGWVKANFIKYDMKDFLEQCVEKYQKLSENRVTLRRVDTPFLDEAKEIDEYDENNPGKLKSIASAVLMKCLYAARMARYDLLRPITALAKCVTKWTPVCDKMLHKLMCYINSTLDVAMYGWIADEMSNLDIVLYCDSDFAGDRKMHVLKQEPFLPSQARIHFSP